MEISDSEKSDNEPMTPPELSKETEESAEATETDPGQHIIPEYSREKYFRAYEVFKEWQMKHGHDEVTEAVMMEFFEELNETKKPSTLWSQYSMLKSTFNLKEDLDISQFKKLRAYLKKQGTGFRNAKSKVLTAANIHDFLIKASDYDFLAEKVIMIFGVVGACRKSEIVDLTLSDILDTGTSLVVTIQATPRRQMRKFTINGDLYKVVKKYMALRPEHAKINRLLLNYQKGKCTQQPIGVNKVGGIPRRIASYLELPEADKYTGHCFRRTSTELLSQSGANVVHVIAGWKANKNSGKSDNSLEFYSQMEASNILKTRMSDIQQPQSHPSTQIIINQIPINQQVGGRRFQTNQGQIITTPKRLYTTVGQLINNAGKLININNSGQVNNNGNASQGLLGDNQQVDSGQHANREQITMKSTGHLQRVQINKQINLVQKPKTSVDDLEASLQVILILGFCGAMRCKELCHLNLNDVEDVGSKFIVSVQDNKNFYPRTFVIMNQYYNLVKKYIALRPENCTNERFLLCYKSGYCIRQPIGKNKISVVPQNVARFLNLPNPPAYTGHCFRRTSTTLLANAGASTIPPPAKRARFSGGSSNQNLQNSQPSTSTVKLVHELKNDEDSVPSPTHNIEEIKKSDSDIPFEQRSNNNNTNFWLTAEPIEQNKEPTKGTNETLNLDGFKFVVVEIDRRIEVVQKGWSPPEGAEYVKPHAIFDSYKSASDYADTINVKKTTRVVPTVVPSPKVISIDADSSNCPEASTQEIRRVVKSGLPIKPINVVKTKVAPTSTPSGSCTPKRIIGTLVKKNNNNQSISVTSANGLKNIVKNKRFIGTLVNKNFNKNSIVSNKQKLDSKNAKSDDPFLSYGGGIFSSALRNY